MRGDGWLRVLAEHNLELRIRRVAGEVLVWENVNICGMINRHELHAVKVNDFLERLHESEGELAVFEFQRVAIEFYVFDGARNVFFVRPDPVTDHTVPEHVSDQAILLAIPGKQRWTGTAAAIHLKKALSLAGSNFNFVLEHAR